MFYFMSAHSEVILDTQTKTKLSRRRRRRVYVRVHARECVRTYVSLLDGGQKE